MREFRIIASLPNNTCSAYKAQVRYKFLFFWLFWTDITSRSGRLWHWSESDCEKLIELYKGEITDVVKTIKG